MRVQSVAYGLIDSIITDDVPSPKNSLTSFDQVCIFESSALNVKYEDFKKSVMGVYKDVNPLEKSTWEEIEEPYDFKLKRSIDSLNDEIVDIFLRISSLVRDGIITHDNTSKLNGLTALEQILAYSLNIHNRKQIEEAKSKFSSFLL